MNPAIFDKPFFEVTLPLMVTIVSMVWLAVWNNNKRIYEILKHLDKIDARLDKIDTRLERVDLDPGTRLTKLAERVWR